MKHNIKQLRQNLHDLKAEGRKTLEGISQLEAIENMNDAQQSELDALNKRADDLEAQALAAQSAMESEEKRLDRERAFLPAADGAPVQVMESHADRNFGFDNLAEFALAVKAATPGGGRVAVDDRLTRMYAAPTNYHQEQGATEGYMVPPAMRESIWEMVFNEGDMLSLVDIEPTASNQVELLADETTPWGSSGVQANWRNEGAQMSASKLSTNSRLVKLHELYAFVLATEELLEDAPRLNDRLTRQAARAIAWKASDAIVYGTGAGQPLGYFTSACLVSVAKEGSQAADTIDDQNVLKMYSRLLMQPGGSPFWLCNPDIVPQLAAMTIGDQPAWTPPSTGLQNAPGGFLLGFPIRWSEHAKTLGDKGDIQLVDPMGYYATRKAAGTQFASSMHLFFDYGVQAFRWMFRFGGQPYLSAAVSPANGSTTKSHFVTLDERA